MIGKLKCGVPSYADGNLIIPVEQHKIAKEIIADMKQSSRKAFSIRFDYYHENRSTDQNALFFALRDLLAEELNVPQEEMYLRLLERYGTREVYTATPEAIQRLSGVYRIIRMVEEAGGGKYLYECFTSSRMLNTKEFSRLIDGTISELKEIGVTHKLDSVLLEYK